MAGGRKHMRIFFLFPVFLLSLAALIRMSLVLSGRLKGPLLSTYEPYGEEQPFYPLPMLLFWMGTLIFTSGVLLYGSARGFIGLDLIGFSLWILALLAHYFRGIGMSVMRLLPTLPRWTLRLRDVAGRVERRRVAYMWLRLPRRTRLLYNISDRFFFLWVDLVVMASVGDT